MTWERDKEINAKFKASAAAPEEKQYIIKIRKRTKGIGYLLWIIIGFLAYLYWSYLNWWLILIGVISALVLGGIVSIIIVRMIEKKTGQDLQTQMQIYKDYQKKEKSKL